MKQKTAWIYCRVAHDGSDGAEALEAQRHRSERCAKEHGFEVVGASSDIGNGFTMNRPGLLAFHTAAMDGKVDILLLCNFARLGRDVDSALQYGDLLRDLGMSVHTAVKWI